ncbi:hypothetical protein Tco_0832024 [Tanacetum coccineum]
MKTGVLSEEGAEGYDAERYRGDSNMAALGVAVVIKEYAHESLTFRDAVSCEAKFSNEMSVQILLGGHSTLSLEGGFSGNRDEEKKSKGSCIYALGSHVYQIVCTRPDIASADVGMLNGFDRGL